MNRFCLFFCPPSGSQPATGIDFSRVSVPASRQRGPPAADVSASKRESGVLDIVSGTSDGPDSAEVCQEDLGATREHGHICDLVGTGRLREFNREPPWNKGVVGVENRIGEVKTKHVATDEASASSEKTLQTEGQALTDGMGAGEVGLQGGDLTRVDGIGNGEVDGRAAAGVDGSDADGLPLVDAKQEKLRTEAVVGVMEPVAGNAVEIVKKADFARARRSAKARRRAEKQERRTLKKARRLKKLLDRERRAKRKGEWLNPSVERKDGPVRLDAYVFVEEGSGMLAQDDRGEARAEVSRLQRDIRAIGDKVHGCNLVSMYPERVISSAEPK